IDREIEAVERVLGRAVALARLEVLQLVRIDGDGRAGFGSGRVGDGVSDDLALLRQARRTLTDEELPSAPQPVERAARCTALRQVLARLLGDVTELGFAKRQRRRLVRAEILLAKFLLAKILLVDVCG